jgi:predicted lipid-binding transport protein (Tim44 family)
LSDILDKYIYTEHKEEDGAKKAYIKDQVIAAKAAEQEDLQVDNFSPEERNRSAEEVIGSEIGTAEGELSVADSFRTETRYDSQGSEGAGAKAFKEAAKVQNYATEEYHMFQREVDREKLDELRKEIREKK